MAEVTIKLNFPKQTFEEWAAKNKDIVAGVFELADGMRARGHKRWSAWAAINVLRWQTSMRDKTQHQYKISNNEIADIARLYNKTRKIQFFTTHRKKDEVI